MLRSIENAKTDDKIKGIFIDANGNANGWGTSEQLREALIDFKQSRKFVIAYGEAISQKAYYVASAADSVFVHPLGEVDIRGLSSSLMFVKGLLDKLELEADVFYCGKFKSATEPLRSSKMTPENRVQISEYQNDIWATVLQSIALHSKMDTAMIDSMVSQHAFRIAQDAVSYRIIDGLKYKDEVEKLLKKKIGIDEDKDLPMASMSDYKGRLSQKPSSHQIALLIGQGAIVDGKGSSNGDVSIADEDFIAEIRKIKDDDKIKAVVMRVNSPGGSVMASENILRELQLLQQKKKLVVSMGDMAASGGYYISCMADSIFAMPNTITGSIGVFSVMFNTSKMLNSKLGITFDTEKTNTFGDMANGTQPLSPKERQIMQSFVDTIYYTFKNRVARGRNMSMEMVDSIAQGRVWTGTDALQLKLVDGLGGLDRAFAAAAKLADIKDYRISIFPKPQSDIQKLLKIMGADSKQDVLMKQMLRNELGQTYEQFSQMRRLLQNPNRTWALMPFLIETK